MCPWHVFHNEHKDKKYQSRAYALKFHGWGFIRVFNPKSDRKSTYRVDVTLTLFFGVFCIVIAGIYLIIMYFLIFCSLQTNVNSFL